MVELGAEVGDYAKVGDNSRVIFGVRVPPFTTIPEKTFVMPHYDTSFLLDNLQFTPDQATVDKLNALSQEE